MRTRLARSSFAVCSIFGLLAACSPATDEDLEDFALETEAATQGPPEANAPKPGEIEFGRDVSERIYGVHIRDQPHEKPKVVYSVALPQLQAAEKLVARGEVTLSRCDPKDIAGQSGDAAVTPCDSHDMRRAPYGYAPRFGAALVLADSPTSAKGKRVSQWFDTKCTREVHHCALALKEVTIDGVSAGAKKFLNLVVSADADGHGAKSWHVMEVERHKGALAVTRLGAGVGSGHVEEANSSKLKSSGAMGIDRPAEDGDPTQVRRLMYQVELDGLKPGDVIDADARMRAYLGNFSCNPLMTGEIVLTDQRDGWKNPKGVDAHIAFKNGRNCADHGKDGCRYEKSGAARLHHDSAPHLWASYVTVALRSCAAAGGKNKWWADPKDGFLRVGVRR
jgi:hypothetical protein